MDLISVVIPVYNAGEYLSVCLDHILCQTYKNIEILLIDDGSTDVSPKICDKYATEDSRIRVFHKANEGVCVARNIGIKNAKGEWIIFCDADDYWMDKTCLAQLVEAGNKYDVDIVRGDYRPVDAEGNELWQVRDKRKTYAYKFLTPLEFLAEVIRNEFFLWLNLFRRKCIIDNDITFVPGRIFLEDMEFFMHLLDKIHSAIYIPLFFYAYRKSGNSVSFKFMEKKLEDAFGVSKKFMLYAPTVGEPLLRQEYYKRGCVVYYETMRTMGIETPYFLHREELCRDLDLFPIYKCAWRIWMYFSPLSYLQPQYACVWFRYWYKARYACFCFKCFVVSAFKRIVAR